MFNQPKAEAFTFEKIKKIPNVAKFTYLYELDLDVHCIYGSSIGHNRFHYEIFEVRK